MMAINIDTEKQKQLLEQGFFIFQRVLASGTVAKLNQMSRWMILIKKSLSISNNNDLVAVLFPTSNFLILLLPD